MVIQPGGVGARWSDPRPELVPLLREGGITAVLVPSAPPAFAARCGEAGIAVSPQDAVSYLTWPEMARGGDGIVALNAGLWPGVTRGAPSTQQGETAGASRQPWVDANGYLIECLKALYPGRTPLLGYGLPPPDRLLPFESLELALLEARMAGGNVILTIESRYRERLLAGDEKARTAWRQLGRTAAWLREHQALFGAQVFPTVTALIEPAETSAEIVNLLYRQGVSPALAGAAAPPPPDPARRLALLAVGVSAPDPGARPRILAHAEAGSTLVVDGRDWWRGGRLKLLREEPARLIYSAGKGRIVAYKEPVTDPNEFAFDVIDLIGHDRRAVRLWNAPSVVPLATLAPPSAGSALLLLVNYGSRASDVLARIQGRYRKATLLPLEGAVAKLKTTIRGAATEVFLAEVGRAAIIAFAEAA